MSRIERRKEEEEKFAEKTWKMEKGKEENERIKKTKPNKNKYSLNGYKRLQKSQE